MRLSEYLLDRIFSLICMLVAALVLLALLWLIETPAVFILFAEVILLAAYSTALLYDFFRKQSFYNLLQKMTEQMDIKTLLGELLVPPHFLEGQILVDVLRCCNKYQNDRLSYAEQENREYREYLDSWVHEIKTPITSARLIVENEKNPTTLRIDDELRKIDAYDYRFISWTVSEINSYMNLLTSEDKTLDLPMVVAEWNKKIPQKNIRWSTDAMQVYLDKYLHENFGDLYTTKIKNCGAVLSNEVEYEPSVYIEATDSAKYPWLSFVVTGEQLTMTQVSFAIYALYLPTKDFQCTQAVDTIEQNQKYQNRLITLKQAQNPKIKNYIESINEILISGLEAWLNNNNTSSMYD